MHIIHIASELAPLAKVGGLADVLLGLCRELSWKGHDVDIIIPKYDCIDTNSIRDLNIAYERLMVPYNGEWYSNTIWMGWVENLRVYFVETHHPRYFFNRGCFYGCNDDIERYLHFSRVAVEFLYKKNLRPNIIHVHDWQTAVIPLLLKDMYEDLGFIESQSVLTIHNLEYQGRCSVLDLDKIGLQGQRYVSKDQLQDPLYPDALNLLKAGIIYSNFFTTVSPTYAKEITTEAFGRGMDKVIIEYSNKFKGILNGLDYSYWNPEIDRYLPAHFSSRETPKSKSNLDTIDKKAFLKKTLRESTDLSEDHCPIIACVCRLVPQKGVELIKEGLRHALKKNCQFILLGSSPIASISAEFHALKHEFTNHPNVYISLHYQEEFAHLIFAGSDMIIVPSIFEPCGLTQMIGFRYGAIPIVRHTGGLVDTVFDVDYSGKTFEETNGYTFQNPDFLSLNSTMDRAITTWFQEPAKWRKLMINSMNMDYSWNRSSDEYLKIYKKLLEEKEHSFIEKDFRVKENL